MLAFQLHRSGTFIPLAARVENPASSGVALQRGPASDKQIAPNILLQGLTHSLLWSHVPAGKGGWQPGCFV